MTKDELIVKQILKIEKYKQMLKANKKLKKSLIMKLYAIGEPLNDNMLQFNKEQTEWCFEVLSLVEQIRGL